MVFPTFQKKQSAKIFQKNLPSSVKTDPPIHRKITVRFEAAGASAAQAAASSPRSCGLPLPLGAVG